MNPSYVMNELGQDIEAAFKDGSRGRSNER